MRGLSGIVTSRVVNVGPNFGQTSVGSPVFFNAAQLAEVNSLSQNSQWPESGHVSGSGALHRGVKKA